MSEGEADIDQWTVQIVARILVRNTVIIVTDKLNKTETEALFMRHAADLQAALDMAFELVGENASVNVIPEGPVVIPIYSVE